jgi:hypothetical protein
LCRQCEWAAFAATEQHLFRLKSGSIAPLGGAALESEGSEMIGYGMQAIGVITGLDPKTDTYWKESNSAFDETGEPEDWAGLSDNPSRALCRQF